MLGIHLHMTKVIMKTRLRIVLSAGIAVLMSGAGGLCRASGAAMPKLIEQNGQYALLVDDQPFFVLGGQAHNSSAWPGMLPQVWAAIEGMHANTLEIPMYWQQIEPRQGEFDFSVVDTIIKEARSHNVRLVLLWFGTWKNGNTDYTPSWIKLNPEKYPHVVGRNGQIVVSPSPFAKATMEADAKAFAAVMKHLKKFDSRHTVIMIQVENEPGTYGSPRDFSEAANKLFDGPVPAALLKSEVLQALNKPTDAKGTWSQVFGRDADEFFHAWAVARYINYVAEAGQAVNPLPMYVNVALVAEPGGAMHEVIPIYKVAAPAVGVLAPDIYQQKEQAMKTMEYYDRPDNALFVPETLGSVDYLYEVIRRGGIGFSPFGVDGRRWSANGTPAAESQRSPLATQYAMLRLADGELGKWIFERRLHLAAVSEQDAKQEVDLGAWLATISFGSGRRWGPLPTTQPEAAASPSGRFGGQSNPGGRAVIAQLGDNEFVVMAAQCRVAFRPSGAHKDKPWQFLKVEEGRYENGMFKLLRLRNGDEVGYGAVSVGAEPVLFRITMTAW